MSGFTPPPLHELIIHNEQPEDQDAVTEVLIQAFINHPHSQQTEHLIVQRLREQDKLSIALVAEYQQQILGFIAISPVQLHSAEMSQYDRQNWYGLGPVAVRPDQQGYGIGSTLIRTALNQLQLRYPCHGCVVLGEPEYYARFGFKAYPQLVLDGVPASYFQALSFADSIPTAQVCYAAAFNCSP